MTDDPRLSDAKGVPLDEVLDRLSVTGLVRVGHELVGPCPAIGCGGTDRFSVDVRKGVCNCRKCDLKGDGIAIVQAVLGCDFGAALDFLAGPRREETPAEKQARREREAEAAKKRKRQEAEAKKRREQARREAYDIWQAGTAPQDTETEAYLARRGLTAARLGGLPKVIRHHPSLRYMASRDGGARWVCLHEGPAMLAAVTMANGRFGAVHRTWIDLSQAKGKAVIHDPDLPDDKQPSAKKSWGIKKGGVIHLVTPKGFNTLVMAEGIETTLSVYVAGLFPGAAFWAGHDLGNMSGQRKRGKGMMYAGLPNLSDAEAFVPPEQVKRLIYLMDGDSEPRSTRAQLEAGCRRAMKLRPGLEAQILPAPVGLDFNDILMGVE